MISPFFGAYSKAATSSTEKAATQIILGWLVAIPSALALRGFLKGYPPPVPFIIVSMISTYLLIFIWRVSYVKLFGETSESEYKKAGSFEIFKMISTLIRRW